MKAPRHWNVQKSSGHYLGDHARAAPQNSEKRMGRQVELTWFVMVQSGRGRLLRPPRVAEPMDGMPTAIGKVIQKLPR
jgi:hypothetical protein